MITLDHLTYNYRGGHTALSDISAEIPTGIHLLMGENGAGKTTLLHIIAGLRIAKPDTACSIDAVPASMRMPSILRRTFLVTDDMTFPYTTINEMVRRHACFYPGFDEQMLRDNLAQFEMTGHEPISRFSLGNRKKAFLAYALSLRTDILLLDEPANGLDINAKTILLKMLSRCVSEEQTVIISTHTVWDLQNLFEGVIVLRGSHLLISMPVWNVTRRLAFISDTTPRPDALYMTQSFGKFHSIVPNDGTLSTDIDYTMLYNALHSPEKDKIINALNTTQR